MPWHLHAIGVADMGGQRLLAETGHGTTVALVDSGVSPHHQGFQRGSIVDTRVYSVRGPIVPGSGSVAPFRLAQEDDHGTAVAGLISASRIGVAPGARLVNIVIPFTNPVAALYTSPAALLTALQHLRTDKSFEVLNLSIAIPRARVTPLVERQCRQILRELAARGVVTIVAVGNRDEPLFTDPGAPACWPEVIAVGAANRAGNRASFSLSGTCPKRGTIPEVMAPGDDVYACRGTGDNRASGTSYACGVVSGVVALMKERNRGASIDACRRSLAVSQIGGVVQAPRALTEVCS